MYQKRSTDLRFWARELPAIVAMLAELGERRAGRHGSGTGAFRRRDCALCTKAAVAYVKPDGSGGPLVTYCGRHAAAAAKKGEAVRHSDALVRAAKADKEARRVAERKGT